MGLPITFATLAGGPQPLSDLDEQFAAVAALGVIPCTATGTNTIALAPFANTPTIVSYPDLTPSFIFVATGTSTGAVTINVNGVGARNAYKWNGPNAYTTVTPAVGVFDIVQGGIYRATPLLALNGGAGGFMVDCIGNSNQVGAIEYIIDGGGSTITTGLKGFLSIPFPCQIVDWTLIADQSGSVTVDLWAATNAIPNSGNSIVGTGTKPTLSSQQIATAGPSGWTTTSLFQTAVLGFDIASVATITRLNVSLLVAKL